ncbi:MAG: TraR/DksA C4-type zinc finger protein [Acidobacteriota bacterium]|nr:TraR/DksA C4-type zinc finger protein [Acidobacteriota bacterium]
MAKTRKRRTVRVVPADTRHDDLKHMLEDRRRELLHEVKTKIRDARADGEEKPHEVLDTGDAAEAYAHEDIEFALIQMKAETLARIDEALSRLEDGTYGHCFQCGGEIAEARLRALPFAVRCKDCEQTREMAEQRERAQQRRGSASLGFDMRG